MDSTPPKPAPPPQKLRLLLLLALLGFLLLAWGVWWFFEWKIRSLGYPIHP